MTDREDLVKILDEYDPEGGTSPGQEEDLETFWGAQADAILGSDWLRKVKADTLRDFAKTLDTYSGTVLNADSAANMARVTANSIEGVSR